MNFLAAGVMSRVPAHIESPTSEAGVEAIKTECLDRLRQIIEQAGM